MSHPGLTGKPRMPSAQTPSRGLGSRPMAPPPIRTATLQVPPMQGAGDSAVEDNKGGVSPITGEHNESDLPSKVDTSESQLSRAGLTLKDVLKTRPSLRRQDTITYRALQGFESASAPATLLATEEFAVVQEKCKALVNRIARDCRRSNRRFRDESWDISADKYLCLQGLLPPADDDRFDPYSVARVNEIFESPRLFVDGVNADDIRQGAIGDCWFVSALAVVSNVPKLLERLCVAYDAQVGIYGFMFFRDGHWLTTIIDDQLFTAHKQYDELSPYEKDQWHKSRKLYEDTNLRGSRALYFAAASDPSETWVPLYEKAYAKAHGDYESMSGGFTGEGIEDLTGGVSTLFKLKDILDTDQFWTDELLHANKDRLFACYIQLDYPGDLTGLVANHAYAILEAKEVNGRKFVVIRNPWGESGEWQGAWSDGSELWTPEWMQALNHKFGNDGRFIMEYTDFLKVWQTVDRCLLFDEAWHVSSAHVETKLRPWPAAPSFGDVCFTVTLTDNTPTIFVLSQHDSRYWKGLEGYLWWSLEFRVFHAGEKDYLARSEKGMYDKRSVNIEFKNLEPGQYIVHVRLDRYAFRDKKYMDDTNCSDAKLYRVHAKMMESRSLAPNYDRSEASAEYLSPPSDVYDGRPLSKIPRVDIVGKVVEKEVAKASTPVEMAQPKPQPQPQPQPQPNGDDSRKTVTISDSPKTTVFNLEEPPKANSAPVQPVAEPETKKEEVGVQADAIPDESKKEDAQPTVPDDIKAAEDRADVDIIISAPTAEAKEGKSGKASEEEDDADGKAEADKKADGEAGKQPDADKEAGGKDGVDKEEEEKNAKEEERKNADSVFLLFRVYSKDASAKIGAETRL